MHVRRALALALVVPLLLAGCTEEEPTPNIPDPTTSSPTSPSPETETAEPESAEDFIRRWVAVNTEMQNSGDASEYRELSSRCRPCLQTAKRIEQIYAGGGFVRTEGWMIQKVIDKTGEAAAPVLDLQIKSSPTEFREDAKADIQELAGGRIVMRVRLTEGSPWQVVRLTQVPS